MTTIIPGTAGHTSSVQQAVSHTGQSNTILDKDAFLKLLITQLANQDPTNPMEDRDFIAQMAQFSSLEQMNNVAGELRGLRQLFSVSSDLIGKTIEWKGSDGADESTKGIVDSILLRNGETHVVVGGKEIPFDRIIRVSATISEPVPDDSGDTGEDGEQAS